MRVNPESGFSLVELLLYQGLLLMILTVATLFLVPSLRLQARGLTQAERLRCAHLGMDDLCKSLRETSQLCLANENGILSGRCLAGWTSDGTALLQDQGWFFDLAHCQQAQLSWRQALAKEPTWREPLSLAQLNLCRPLLRWRTLSPESCQVTFTSVSSDGHKPRGPYSVVWQIGDLNLQQTVQPRLLR